MMSSRNPGERVRMYSRHRDRALFSFHQVDSFLAQAIGSQNSIPALMGRMGAACGWFLVSRHSQDRAYWGPECPRCRLGSLSIGRRRGCIDDALTQRNPHSPEHSHAHPGQRPPEHSLQQIRPPIHVPTAGNAAIHAISDPTCCSPGVEAGRTGCFCSGSRLAASLMAQSPGVQETAASSPVVPR